MLSILDEANSISQEFQFWILEGNSHQVWPARVNFLYDLFTVMIGVLVSVGKKVAGFGILIASSWTHGFSQGSP